MAEEDLKRAIELTKRGEKEEARRLLNRILEENPNHEAAYLWYVDTMATGDQERYEALRQFLSLNPESQAVRKALDVIANRLPAQDRRLSQAGTGGQEPESGGAEPSEHLEPLSYFTEQPVSVSPRFAPGTVRRAVTLTGFSLAGIIFLAFVLLPIWDQQSLFGFIRSNFASLVAEINQARLRPTTQPTPSADSILFAELSSVCLTSSDLPDGYLLENEFEGVENEQLKSFEREGLERYYGGMWTAPGQPTQICDVMVYRSQDAAVMAFSGIELEFRSSAPFDLGSYGDDSVGNVVVGAQYVYTYAFRKGRAILKLTTIGDDRVTSLESLERSLPFIDAHLQQYDSR